MAAKKSAKKSKAAKPVKSAKPAKKAAKPAAKKATKQPAKKAKVSWLAKGYQEAIAYMNQNDASATIEFMKEVFGAKVRMTMPGASGKIMHAELLIGKAVVMVSDAVMEPARVSGIMVYAPDIDKVFAKATAAGATVMMAPMDSPWGDRFGRFSDPFGNFWSVSTHIEDLTPKEITKRMKAEEARRAAASAPAADTTSAPN